jgi:hypothetical protein
MRFYKIQIGSGASGLTFDSTNDPNALQVELDVAQGPNHAPANANGAVARVWGISLQTILTANQFNNKPISVYGGMQRGLPLANPSEQGLLVQGQVYPCIGTWRGTDMYLEFYIKPGVGVPDVPQAANVVHNQPANQPISTAIQNALKTAFPGFTANVRISPNLVRPNDENGFYQTLGQYSTYLFNTSKDIVKTPGYLGVQVVVQGKTINVYDGTQAPSAAGTIEPWDLIGQPNWTGVNTIQFMTVMRGDLDIGKGVTLPKSLATLSQAANTALPGVGASNIIQGSFTITSLRHVGNFRQPDWSSWATVIDAVQPTGGASGHP